MRRSGRKDDGGSMVEHTMLQKKWKCARGARGVSLLPTDGRRVALCAYSIIVFPFDKYWRKEAAGSCNFYYKYRICHNGGRRRCKKSGYAR